MTQSSGFGKTILIGDQFVLRGVPAIVSALPYSTVATVELCPGQGWSLRDKRPEVPGYKASKLEQQAESINRTLEVLGIDVGKTPIKITFGGSLLAGSGVGASAASCVSLARALNSAFDLGLGIAEINLVAKQGEVAYHGIPSGIDNTVSTYGGLLVYHIRDRGDGQPEPFWERIKIVEPIRVVLANSGVTADTSTLDGFVLAIRQRDPEGFAAQLAIITEQSQAMRQALESTDLAQVGALMTANHEILIAMGLSHAKLIYLCNKALALGALGAKVTGGGRGGYMLALTPGEALQNTVAGAFEGEGFKVIRATIGGSEGLLG